MYCSQSVTQKLHELKCSSNYTAEQQKMRNTKIKEMFVLQMLL